MNTFRVHAAARLRFPFTGGGACLLGAVCFSLISWDILFDPALPDPTGPLATLVRALTSLWIAGMLAPGVAGSVFPIHAGQGYPFPTLPLQTRPRVLIEALVGLVWLVAFRAALRGLFGALPGATEALGALTLFPTLLACLAMPALGMRHMVKPLVAAVLMAVAFTALGRDFMAMAACSLVLGSAVLLVEGREVPAWRVAGWPHRRPWRPARHPVVQLWKDALFGTLRAFGLVAVLSVPLFLLDVGFQPLALWFLPIMMPLGLNFRAHAPAGGGGVTGGWLHAWSCIPVAPHHVFRAVYVHGALVGVFLGAGLHPMYERDGLELVGWTVVPLLAGGMTAALAGDTWRTIVSGVCLTFLLLLAPMLTLTAHNLREGVYGTVLVACTLTLAGGVPPLVHLRRRR